VVSRGGAHGSGSGDDRCKRPYDEEAGGLSQAQECDGDGPPALGKFEDDEELAIAHNEIVEEPPSFKPQVDANHIPDPYIEDTFYDGDDAPEIGRQDD